MRTTLTLASLAATLLLGLWIASCSAPRRPLPPPAPLPVPGDLWQPQSDNRRVGHAGVADLPETLQTAFQALLATAEEPDDPGFIAVSMGPRDYTACGSSRLPLPQVTWHGEPRAGRTIRVAWSTAAMDPPATPVALFAGAPATANLTALGYPDCYLLVSLNSPVVLYPGSDIDGVFYQQGGHAWLSWALPEDAVGQHWRLQLVVMDASAQGGLVLSPGLDVWIGRARL